MDSLQHLTGSRLSTALKTQTECAAFTLLLASPKVASTSARSNRLPECPASRYSVYNVHQSVINLDEVHREVRSQTGDADRPALFARPFRSFPFCYGQAQIEPLNAPLYGAVVGRGKLPFRKTPPDLPSEGGEGRPLGVR